MTEQEGHETKRKPYNLPPPVFPTYHTPSFANPNSQLFAPPIEGGSANLDRFLMIMRQRSAGIPTIEPLHPIELPSPTAPLLYDLLNTEVYPQKLNLYPSSIFKQTPITVRQLIDTHFKRRSSKKMPFHLKLFNALQLTTDNPNLVPLLGVKWITDRVFKLYREPFAKIIGVSSVNGSLFNKQGSFPTHGFILVSRFEHQLQVNEDLSDVDDETIRLYRHNSENFHQNATEEELNSCRWRSPRD